MPVVFWLKDESLEESGSFLASCHRCIRTSVYIKISTGADVLVQGIVEDVGVALKQCSEIAVDLGEEADR